jgi:Glycerophosphoryl diester phosphodiesterase
MPTRENPPLIIAHRGDSAFAPENTLAAFRKAVEAGADGIEFDVRISKDGVPVVFHDSTLKRISRREGRTSSFTAEELASVDVGAWFNGKYPARADEKFYGEGVPTLEKLLSFLEGYDGRLYLEMKGSRAEVSALTERVAEIIRRSEFLPQMIVKSFKLEAVAKIKTLLPEVKTAALLAPKILTLLKKQSRIIECAREHSVDELSLHYSLATKKLVRKASAEGFRTTIWTANHTMWVRRAAEIGIYAVITNNPARMLARRERLKL